MSSPAVEVLKCGRWSSGYSAGYVWIVRQSRDYYHEEFYEEGPDLDADGWAYYALYGSAPALSEHSSRSRTCLSEQEAVAVAEGVLGSVEWGVLPEA